jgi:N-acetylmuramoyl-L-alanine amidase
VGSELKNGGVVTLVISAGSEDFPMPDVIGSLAATARSLLEAKGLIVSLEPVMSEAPSDTVMSSIPATGAQVRTGDRVVLQVAAATAPGVTLQPYDLTGVAVTLDPSPAAAGTTDIPLEVARRVRALLEASGAIVVTLRSSSDTDTTDASRAARAVAATSVVAVGFDLTPAPQTGRVVRSPSQASAQILTASTLLSSAITSELVSVAAPVVSDTTPTDSVLSAVSVPWVRVLLGSGTAREDQAVFTDPTWADKVARAVYIGIGKSYGVVRQP